MNALAIIPARGGSKAVLRKNLAPLAGEPLISYVIAAVRACPEVTRLIVSTDDEEIAAAARKLGADVPFLRPAELARDDATLPAVAYHTHQAMERLDDCQYDLVVVSQPTCPLVRPTTISTAIGALADSEADGLMTVYENTHYYWRLDGDGEAISLNTSFVNRQQLEPIYRQTGVVYVCRRGRFGPAVWGHDMLFLEVAEEEGMDIDDYADMFVAELMIRGRKLADGPPPTVIGRRRVQQQR